MYIVDICILYRKFSTHLGKPAWLLKVLLPSTLC